LNGDKKNLGFSNFSEEKMMIKKAAVLLLVISISGYVSGITYDVDIEYTSGSGSNEAKIVIDFDLDNYFIFKFQWEDDSSPTGWDALDAIDTAGDLYVDATWYEFWQSHFVNGFDYPSGVEYNYGQGAMTGWHYYGSVDNTNWSENTGVDNRILSDGDWDSWVWTNYNESWLPLRGPGQVPVPEPMTIVLLGFGVLILRRRKQVVNVV
jgi:hypothetical protein